MFIKRKDRAPFTKYAGTIVGSMLVCCVGLTFLMFKTDVMMKGEDVTDVAKVQQSNNRTRVDYNIQTEASVEVPGITKEPFQSTGEWYEDVQAGIKPGNPVQTLNLSDGVVSLYDNVPWESVDGCYFYNVVVASQDLVAWLDSESGKASGLSTETTFTYELSSKECVGTIDGVNVIKSPYAPCVVARDYNNKFTDSPNGWYTSSTPAEENYGYYNNGVGRKYCVVLEDQNGNTLYMPAAAKDAKGHTFPGGVIQTHLKLARASDSSRGPFVVHVGDTGPRFYGPLTAGDIVDQLDTLIAEPGGNWTGASKDTLRKYIKNCLEIYGGTGSDCNLLNKYTIKGYIAWPN